MKKIFALILTIVFATALCCGCGGTDEAQVPADMDTPAQSEAQTVNDNDSDDAGYVKQDSAAGKEESSADDNDETYEEYYEEEYCDECGDEEYIPDEEDRDWYEEYGDEDCDYNEEELGEDVDAETEANTATGEDYPKDDANAVEPNDDQAAPNEPSVTDDAGAEDLGEI